MDKVNLGLCANVVSGTVFFLSSILSVLPRLFWALEGSMKMIKIGDKTLNFQDYYE